MQCDCDVYQIRLLGNPSVALAGLSMWWGILFIIIIMDLMLFPPCTNMKGKEKNSFHCDFFLNVTMKIVEGISITVSLVAGACISHFLSCWSEDV